MKRRFRIWVSIIVIIAVVAISLLAYYLIKVNGRKYEIAQIKEYNYFILKKDNSYGVIDKNGNTIIEPSYTEIKIPNPENDIFVCYQGEDIAILNNQRQEIMAQYEKVEPIRLKNIASDLMYEKTVLKYLENGKYGLIDLSGKKVTNAIYEELDSLPYKEGELLVKQDGKYGVINIKGNEIVKNEYDSIAVDGYYTDENSYKYSGYIVSRTTDQGYRYGYIDYKGSLLLETEYNELERITDIEDNENAYLIGAKNGQYGVIKNKDNILNNEYQSIRYDKSNDVLVIEKSKKYGIAKLDGQIIVPVEYNQIDITGIYLYAQNTQGTTVYNGNGTEANVDSDVAILETGNEKYRIRINNKIGSKYGVIDDEGKQLIEEKYNYIEYLYEDYFIASSENSKLGVINKKDEIQIQFECDSIQRIKDTELIKTVVNQTTTRMYKKDMMLACEMQNANIEVKGNYIKIYNETDTKYFDKQGNEVTNKEVYPNNLIFAAKNEQGKWGFVDKSGNVVVDYQYDNVTEINEYGYAGIKQEGKWGVINQNGEIILKPSYELQDEVNPIFMGVYHKLTYNFGEFYFEDLST